MDIVCVGDCGVDHYLPSGERCFGGITANFARHAKDCFPPGDRIRLVSCVGNDPGAGLVLSSLEDSGIDCHVSRLAGTTPVQYIETRPDGEKDFIRYDEGVLRDFRFSAEQKSIIAEGDVLVAPVYLQIVGLFDELMAIRSSGLVSIDFADFLQHPDFNLLEKHVDSIDIAFFGLTSDDAASIDEIAALAARHDKLFIVTLGADGSRAFEGKRQVDCLAAPVARVVDTTGAGDAFAAGFLSRFSHGAAVAESLREGAALAAKIIGRIGSYHAK